MTEPLRFWGTVIGSRTRHLFTARNYGDSAHAACGTKSVMVVYTGNVSLHGRGMRCLRCLARVRDPLDHANDHIVEELCAGYDRDALWEALQFPEVLKHLREALMQDHEMDFTDWHVRVLVTRALYQHLDDELREIMLMQERYYRAEALLHAQLHA